MDLGFAGQEIEKIARTLSGKLYNKFAASLNHFDKSTGIFVGHAPDFLVYMWTGSNSFEG